MIKCMLILLGDDITHILLMGRERKGTMPEKKSNFRARRWIGIELLLEGTSTCPHF